MLSSPETPQKYVYVVRNTCHLTPDVSNICLEMYVSYDEEDTEIMNKQRRIANNLQCPIIIDIYQEYDNTKIMLWYKSYTISHDQ